MNNEQQNKRAAYQKMRKKQIRLNKKRRAKRFFIIFVIIYVLIALLFLLFFSLSLKSCEKSEKKHDVTVENKENKQVTLDKDDIYFDNTLYLPISVIDDLTDIKVTGDKDEISFIIEENSEFAKFKVNTTSVNINGNQIELTKNSLLINEQLYIPFDFFEKNMKGLKIELNAKNDSYVISLDNKASLQFILKAPAQTPPISESESSGETEEPIDFILDLSSYEEYMNPAQRDEYLILVNTDNPLTREYAPTDLTGSIYTRSDRDTRTLRKYACLALEAFLKEAGANGINDVTVTSAYRSYDYQEQLFNNEVALLGSKEAAAKNVNPPGSSEHQTGLAVDMHNMSAASREFANTNAAKWLAENAHNFGFILRYPKDKTDITGISFEPWHFRYVGRYHATKMYELDMCLEEYIEYINQ